MAARYWVGGTDNWNGTAASKWATTSGGAGGVAIPTAADDVFFDAASGAAVITLATSQPCRSINCTGFTGTFTISTSVNLSVGDGTAGASNIALKFVAGMSFTKSSNTSSLIQFLSTSATQQSIDFGGKEPGAITFNGAGGSWILAANMNANNSSPIVHTSGALDTAGFSVNCLSFTSNNSNTRTLTLGSSSLTLNGSGGSWTLTTTTGLTFSGASSTITLISGNSSFSGGGLTYGTVVLNPTTGGTINYVGTNTFGAFTVNGGSSGRVTLSNDVTVTGLFTAASTASTDMSFILSSSVGVQRTISAGSVSLTNHNFQDIIAGGASAPWTATSNVGDAGGNSGITFSAPVTRYWVGGTGSFNSTTKWATSSGGTSGASIPLCHDTAVFDSQSVTSGSQTLTVNVQVIPGLDFTNALNAPTIASTITNGIIYANGNLIYKAGLTISGTTAIRLIGRTAGGQIKCAGLTLTNAIQISAFGGTYTLQDAFTSSSAFTLNNGVFTTANFAFTAPSFNASNTDTRTANFGSSTITLNGTGTVMNFGVSTGLTFNSGTSTIVVSDASGTSKTFNGGAQTFNNVTFTGGGAGVVLIQTANTFNNLTLGAPKTYTFTSAVTNTILGNFLPLASVGNVVTINASVGGSRSILSKASGIVSGDYLNITDSSATGGAYWAAGNNSTNGGNNLGWVFGAATFAKTIADTARAIPLLVKSIGKNNAGTVSVTEAIARAITKRASETATVSGNPSKSIDKPLTNTVTAVEAHTKAIGKSIENSVTAADGFSRVAQYQRTVAETITVTEARAKSIGKFIANTVTVDDDITSGIYQPFNGREIALQSKADVNAMASY